jgi:hypothetical protein
LVAVKDAILPVPLAARPMDGVLLVQLYTIVPPVVGLLNVTAAVAAPLHTVWFATAVTVAVGFTVIVKVIEGPVQTTEPLLYCGVTVIVPLIGALVALVPVKPNIFPVPLAGIPIAELLLVQDIILIPPVVETVKFTGGIGAPLHTT